MPCDASAHRPDLAGLVAGQRVDGEVLVLEAAIAPTKNGSPYLRLAVRDAAGHRRVAKVWDFQRTPPAPGQLVTISATCVRYQDNLELVVDSLHLVGPADPAEWTVQVHVSLAERTRWLHGAIEAIENDELGQLVRAVFAEAGVATRFLNGVAAKMYHSAKVGGLALHTRMVHDTALFAARSTCRLEVDLDLLRAGALLHDVGKIDEFEISSGTGLVPAYTSAHLRGHVALALCRVERIRLQFGLPMSGRIGHLMHLIVSHHGGQDGAAEKPMTVEATLLHAADYLASRTEAVCDLVEAAAIGAEWTDYSRMLGERVYLGAGLSACH